MKANKTRKRGMVDIRHAAGLLRIDPLSVYRAIWEGRLRGHKLRGHWIVTLSAIRHYKARRRKHEVRT